MAVQTIYILAQAGVTPNFFGPTQLNGSAPTAANTAYGWGVGKNAVTSPYYRGRLGATAVGGDAAAAASYNAGTSAPAAGTGTGASTAGDSFVAGPFTGTFAATAWTFNCNLRAGVAGAIGHINLRVWRSPNANGSAAVQLVANTAGATVTLSTTADVNSSVSFSPGALTLTAQYLFFQVEWQETTAGSSNTDNILFRAGTASITTADFVAAATATLAATQANQTVAATGNVPVVGTLSRPEINDTFTGTGGPRVNGTLALQQATQTLVAAGGPSVGGALSVIEIADTISATGSIISAPATATLSVTEIADAISASGNNGGPAAITGALAITAAPDALSATGAITAAIINLAFSGNGGVASASSSYGPMFPPSNANKGSRDPTYGTGWGGQPTPSGGWNDGTQNVFPDTWDVVLSGTFYISEIDVITLKDNYSTPGVPTLADTFTSYGITKFDVLYWDGTAFQTLYSTTTNNHVWTQIKFAPVLTSRIRVQINGSASAAGWSSLVEVEAWGTSGSITGALGVAQAGQTLVGLANSGQPAVTTLQSPTNMTAMNAPPPYVASESTDYQGAYPAYKAFDGYSGDFWNSDVGLPQWVGIDLGYPQWVNIYKYQARSPPYHTWVSWILQGSNDQVTWTLCDTRNNEPAFVSSEQRAYAINAPGVFRYWRWTVSDSLSHGYAEAATLELWYYTLTQQDQTLVAAGTSPLVTGGTLNLTQASQIVAAAAVTVVVGALSAPQAPQSFTGAAGPVVGGSLGVGQASHTIAASGAPIVSGGLTLPQAPQTLAGAGGPRVGGTLAAPQAAQTLSGTGTVLSAVNGTLALQQATQTLVATGTSPWVANLALTEALDTISAAGGPRVGGILTATEALDTIAATAGPLAGAALTANQAPQTLVAAGGPRVSGALSTSQAANTIAALGSVVVRGTLTAPQAAQTLAGAGIVASGATATLSVTQAAQTLNGAGTVTGVAGGLAAIEALDTINAAGGPVVRGTLATQQAPHTIVGTAASIVGGALSTSQAAQALVATGRVVVGGALNLSQAAQTIAAAAGITVRGGLSATQDAQTLTAAAGPIARGTLAATEALDALAATATVVSGPVGNLYLAQADQTLVATAWIEWGQAEDSTEPGWILSEFGPPLVYPPTPPSDASTEAGYLAAAWAEPLPPIPPSQAPDSSQRGYLSSIKGA